MREFRLAYGSPCRTDRLRKTGNVYSRVNVCVPPVSARTGKAMLIPFSHGPADRACLARVRGVDEDHGDSSTSGLVGHKVLQLPEGPSMQACANPRACPDTITDVRQVFHADFPHMQPVHLLNDGLGYFVVDVFDMPPLPTGDSPQLPLGGTATVGLETTAMGKVFVPFKTQLPATKDLATARGGEIVFSNIHSHCTFTRGRFGVRDVQYQIKKPLPFAANQFRFFGFSGRHQVGLMFSAHKWHGLTARQCEQRNRAFSQGIGAMVVMDRRTVKPNGRNRFVLGNALVGLERFIRTGNPVNGIAGHLATQIRGTVPHPIVRQVMQRRDAGSLRNERTVPHPIVRQVMQRHTVPASMFHSERNHQGAGLRKHGRKIREFRGLLRSGSQFQGNCTFHIGNYTSTKIALQAKDKRELGWSSTAALSLPRLERRGFPRNWMKP